MELVTKPPHTFNNNDNRNKMVKSKMDKEK